MTAYFREKSLVRQQLDSFNEFLAHTVQQLVAAQSIELHVREQYRPGQMDRAEKVPSPRLFLRSLAQIPLASLSNSIPADFCGSSTLL